MVKEKKRVRRGNWLRRLVKKRGKKVKTSARRSVKKTGKKRAVSRKSAKKEERFEVGFEEVIVKCPNCGREFRVVKSSGFSMEGMLCQRCAAGGGIGLEESDDF